MSISSQMPEELLASIAAGIARGEYSLLLGAGASMGALGGNGVPLPSGPQLSQSLKDAFSIDAGEKGLPLPRIYEAARRQDSFKLTSFLFDWFTGCTPSWQHIFADFQWRRIWTLNIDDVIENVYKSRGINVPPFDWTSNHRDTQDSAFQVIHLHGFLDSESKEQPEEPNLVFSLGDYAARLSDPRSWHAVFNNEFTDLPFVVIGASLSEEIDLIQALSAGSNSQFHRGLPSVVVLPSVSKFQREELASFGLRVIEADGHTFMKALLDTVQNLKLALGYEYGKKLTPELSRFLQQFIDLRKYEPIPHIQSHASFLATSRFGATFNLMTIQQ